jgi:predicted Zn-dependent protease
MSRAGFAVSRLGFTLSIALVMACGGESSAIVEREDTGGIGASSDELEQAFPGEASSVGEGDFEVNNVKQRLTYRYVNGHVVVDGDMILSRDDDFDGVASVQQGVAAVTSSGLWPNGVVPYVIDPALPNQARVTQAIAVWNTKTNVKFVARTNQSTYVLIRPGSGCSADVGYRAGSVRKVNLANNCSTGNTIHELGHIVGLWHEQSRSDRDTFLEVKWANVQPGMEHNFKTYRQQLRAGQDVGAYDFNSVMHYAPTAFSINGLPTLVKKGGGSWVTNRTTLSANDLSTIGLLYK